MILSLTALAALFVPESATRLSAIDLAIVALYLIAITIFGLRFSRKEKLAGAKSGGSLKSYFLADNTIPWWAIALSIVSAETSTLTIVSIPGVAFGGDFGFLQIVLGYMIGRVVVAGLFLPKYFRGEMLTAYQLIDQRFGRTLHKVTAGLFLLTRAAAEGVRVFAISIVVGIAIGTGDTLSIAIISGLTLLYTFEGGMAAVIWTDVVQMGLYVAGTLVALFTLSAHVPGGWSQIHDVAAPLGKFHMLNFALNLTTTYTFWAGILGGTFLTMASHGTDQLMVQRMLAARNLRESRLALLSSGVVIFLQFTLFLLIGVGLFVFYGTHPQRFASADRIFPTFIVTQMPRGIAGLLVAAILAAAMSNLSAALNSLSSTTVVDFYVPWRRLAERAKEPNTTLVSRVATVFWAVALFLIAVYSIQVGGKGHVVETGLSIASVAYGCLLGVFLLGTLTRYATQGGAIVGMIVGFAVNLTLWLPTITPVRHVGTLLIPKVAFTWYVLVGAVVTFVVGSVASFVRRKPRRAIIVASVLFSSLLLASRGQAQQSGSPGTANVPLAVSAPGDFSEVSTLIENAIAQKKLPGAVVLIGHNGQIVFQKAYGLRKLAGEPSGVMRKQAGGSLIPVEQYAENMTLDTFFDMASLTKVLVTTTAILQLYEEHKLDLDAPVAKYLPAFAVHGKEKITVRQLLTHYSGLPEDVDLKDDWGLRKADRAEGLSRALGSVPYGPAGVTFKYSDVNFITLGFLVESISGEDLDAYSQKHIFEPLGMGDTRYLDPSLACDSYDPYRAGTVESNITVIVSNCTRLDQWNFPKWYSNTAPTAHDDQGTAQTNPDFDHLLRATVHDPTTRRMGGVAGHAGVFSTAADAAKFCQALLDKLTKNTGPFPLTQATLRLATTPNEPVTAVQTATIFTQDGQTTKGEAARGLGWDLNSAFSRPRGVIFPLTDRNQRGSFGHTGFTGTSLWIDPGSQTYVILLANAIHPRGGASISPLRGQVATAAAKALGICAADKVCDSEIGVCPKGAICDDLIVTASDDRVSEGPKTLSGIDVLEAGAYVPLKKMAKKHGDHLRVGVLTNQSGVDGKGRRTIDLLAHAAAGIEVTKIFSPEHGLYGKQDKERLAAESDPVTHLPVISVYGPKMSDKHPKQADLRDLDAVVIDLQDAGVRFWTYETLVGYFLEACSRAEVEVILLDRPNPIGGLALQGPTSDLGFEAIFTDFMPLPLRHSLTLGELARYFNANATEVQLKPELLDARATIIGDPATETAAPATQPGLHAMLTVIPMKNWSRAQFYEDTGVPWIAPSPNLRTPRAAVLYPALGLTEQTNVSVGRGTETPFENLGAAWIDGPELAGYLTGRHIAGVRFAATTMAVAEDANKYPFHGQTIPAVHFEVTDRAALDSPELGVEVLAALHRLYPGQFQLGKAKNLLANAATLDALAAGQDPKAIAAGWVQGLESFRKRTQPYLLYP